MVPYLKVPDALPEDGREHWPGLGLEAGVAELQQDQHPRDVRRVHDHEVRLKVKLGSDELKWNNSIKCLPTKGRGAGCSNKLFLLEITDAASLNLVSQNLNLSIY